LQRVEASAIWCLMSQSLQSRSLHETRTENVDALPGWRRRVPATAQAPASGNQLD
jgi:hypothetical protein